MSKVKCEICHIKTNRVGDQQRLFMAKFPLNPDRCKKWVAATGNEELIYVPIEKLHQSKYICGKHFRPRDFCKKKKQLRRTAVPCIEISPNQLKEEMFKNFPLHIVQEDGTEYEPSKSTSRRDHCNLLGPGIPKVQIHSFPNFHKFPGVFNPWLPLIGEKLEKTEAVPSLHVLNYNVFNEHNYCCNQEDEDDTASQEPTILMGMPGVPLHRFPDPEKYSDKYKTWISNIGGVITALDQISVYNNNRVCRRHFQNCHLYPKNRLCKLAVPVLHLPGLDNVILHRFPNPTKEPDRFHTWLYSIGGDILALDNQHIFNYRRVCHIHFAKNYNTRSGRLSCIAVPTHHSQQPSTSQDLPAQRVPLMDTTQQLQQNTNLVNHHSPQPTTVS